MSLSSISMRETKKFTRSHTRAVCQMSLSRHWQMNDRQRRRSPQTGNEYVLNAGGVVADAEAGVQMCSRHQIRQKASRFENFTLQNDVLNKNAEDMASEFWRVLEAVSSKRCCRKQVDVNCVTKFIDLQLALDLRWERPVDISIGDVYIIYKLCVEARKICTLSIVQLVAIMMGFHWKRKSRWINYDEPNVQFKHVLKLQFSRHDWP